MPHFLHFLRVITPGAAVASTESTPALNLMWDNGAAMKWDDNIFFIAW
jgi:hypothetical protein